MGVREMGENPDGFWCMDAWCAKGSTCCKNGDYGLCGSPNSKCCYGPPPNHIINLAALGRSAITGLATATLETGLRLPTCKSKVHEEGLLNVVPVHRILHLPTQVWHSGT